MTNETRTPPTLQGALREYYDRHALDEAVLERLRTGRPRETRAWPWALAGALAATLVLATLGVALKGRAWLPPAADAAVASELPRLVAVQIRADWCPRTPEVGPVFAKLLTEYGNEPILFVTLDITDDPRREQAALLSKNLGIPLALEEPFGSGMIKLIDRENHRLLAAVTRPEQLEQFGSRIVEALDGTEGVQHKNLGGGA
jgi:thiol-disulfide isomerase/thioredoxin